MRSSGGAVGALPHFRFFGLRARLSGHGPIVPGRFVSPRGVGLVRRNCGFSRLVAEAVRSVNAHFLGLARRQRWVVRWRVLHGLLGRIDGDRVIRPAYFSDYLGEMSTW